MQISLSHQASQKPTSLQQLIAGTGFMMTLWEAIKELNSMGYTESLIPCFDHLSCQSGTIKIYPHEIDIDDIFRFENSSDPCDQSILFAISSKTRGIKGLYVDSYGLYHDELSMPMLERIKLSRIQH